MFECAHVVAIVPRPAFLDPVTTGGQPKQGKEEWFQHAIERYHVRQRLITQGDEEIAAGEAGLWLMR